MVLAGFVGVPPSSPPLKGAAWTCDELKSTAASRSTVKLSLNAILLSILC